MFGGLFSWCCIALYAEFSTHERVRNDAIPRYLNVTAEALLLNCAYAKQQQNKEQKVQKKNSFLEH